MLELTYSERFQKHYKKLSADEKNQLKKKLTIFSNNPFHHVSRELTSFLSSV